jgi:hypothetical protein
VKISYFFLIILLAGLFSSCDKASNNPKGCVTALIVALEQHDMGKAWGLLSKEAQSYYNDLGEKTRRSGRGALEAELKKIKSFRSVSKDFSIRHDKENGDVVKLVFYGGNEFKIQTVNEDGDYKIKDVNSLRTLLEVITAEKSNENGY